MVLNALRPPRSEDLLCLGLLSITGDDNDVFHCQLLHQEYLSSLGAQVCRCHFGSLVMLT
jgi:hypothetical protein